MKMILGSRICQYVKRFGPLLIVAVLVMGLASCDGSCGGAPVQYELNTSSSEGGDVIVSGEGTYADGTIVTIEAVADTCYEFVEWTGADVADPYSPITTVTMDEAKSITANFALISYDLTTDSTDGGSITSPGENTFLYDCGTEVDLAAATDEGYYFVNWSGDVDTIASINMPTTTITMMADYSITANFELIPLEQFSLTTSSTAGGSVTTPGEGAFNYDAGTLVDLVAEAEEGYSFVEWSGDIGTVGNRNAVETTITMNGTYNITANFSLFAGGNGTAEDPYQIADWWHLHNVRNYLSSHFILTNGLDSDSAGYAELAGVTADTGKGWQPIGSTAANSTFVGSFDGQGHQICDLFIDRSDESDVGLFGLVGAAAVIENVGVNGNVTGYDDAGALVGKNEGTVSSSYSSGHVIGNDYVGGLMGKNEGTTSNSSSTSSVTGDTRVGGLVGQNSNTVSGSYATGNVTGTNYVGGLMGRNEGPVGNSYATGRVTGDAYVGGLVGKNEDNVSNSYSTGSVTGSTSLGGLVGKNDGTVSNCFWDTQTSGQAGSDGGIGKTTAQMKDVDTFSGASWDIATVDGADDRNTDYVWNIVDDVAYPFLSWQPL